MSTGTGAELRARVSALEALTPGPELAAGLAGLPGAEDEVWHDDAAPRAVVVALWDRLVAWAQAQALDHFAAEIRLHDEASDITATEFLTEVALETRTTHRAVSHRAGTAVALDEQFPAARAALHRGELTLGHVAALDRHAGHLDPASAAAVDRAVTPSALARGWTPTQLAAATRRAVLRVTDDGGRAAHNDLMTQASVQTHPGDYGTSRLEAYGDAVTIAEIMSAVDARAQHLRTLTDIPTPIGRLRFAALADLVLREDFHLRDHVLGSPWPATASDPAGTGGAAGDPLSPTARARRRRRGETLVSIDLTTLLSLDEHPGELEAVGPIPGFLARLVAADTTLRRLVTDPVTAEALDLGRHAYTPSDALAAHIRVRDRTCRFPGCTRSLHGMEIDHIQAKLDHGHTTRTNLHLLCRRHHLLKTAGKIVCRRDSDGRLYWTTRHNRRHLEQPPDDPLKHRLHPPAQTPATRNIRSRHKRS